MQNIRNRILILLKTIDKRKKELKKSNFFCKEEITNYEETEQLCAEILQLLTNIEKQNLKDKKAMRDIEVNINYNNYKKVMEKK